MRVLLVEDDRRIASDIVRALEAAGYLVETASDGKEAWFRGDTEDYGAIILDLGKAPLQESSFGILPGQFEGAAVRRFGVASSSEAAAEIGTGGVGEYSAT